MGVFRVKVRGILVKIGISKIAIKWLFSRLFKQIAVSEILPIKQGLKQ